MMIMYSLMTGRYASKAFKIERGLGGEIPLWLSLPLHMSSEEGQSDIWIEASPWLTEKWTIPALLRRPCEISLAIFCSRRLHFPSHYASSGSCVIAF